MWGLDKKLRMVSLRHFSSLISKHIKNLVSCSFIKGLFKCPKINKLINFRFSILRFWSRHPIYPYYLLLTILYYTILYYTILYYTILWYNIYYTILTISRKSFFISHFELKKQMAIWVHVIRFSFFVFKLKIK